MPLPYVTPKKLEQEIVTVKAELEKEIEQKSDLPEVTSEDKNKFLHTNETTGDLEWSEVASGGTDVVANPEGEATVQLTKLQVEDTVYSIPEGTAVEANPQDEATVQLTKLKVDNTTYSVPQGGGNESTIETVCSILCPENLDGSYQLFYGAFPNVEMANINSTKFAAHLNDIIPDDFCTFWYAKNSSEETFEIGTSISDLWLGLYDSESIQVSDVYSNNTYVAGPKTYICHISFTPDSLVGESVCCSGTLTLQFCGPTASQDTLTIPVDGIDCTGLNLPDSDEFEYGTFTLHGAYKTAWLSSIISYVDTYPPQLAFGSYFPETHSGFRHQVFPISTLQLNYFTVYSQECNKQFDNTINLDYLKFIDITWQESAS